MTHFAHLSQCLFSCFFPFSLAFRYIVVLSRGVFYHLLLYIRSAFSHSFFITLYSVCCGFVSSRNIAKQQAHAATPNSCNLLFSSRAERSRRSRDQQHLRKRRSAREERGIVPERGADSKLHRLADLLRVLFVVFERSPRFVTESLQYPSQYPISTKGLVCFAVLDSIL